MEIELIINTGDNIWLVQTLIYVHNALIFVAIALETPTTVHNVSIALQHTIDIDGLIKLILVIILVMLLIVVLLVGSQLIQIELIINTGDNIWLVQTLIYVHNAPLFVAIALETPTTVHNVSIAL